MQNRKLITILTLILTLGVFTAAPTLAGDNHTSDKEQTADRDWDQQLTDQMLEVRVATALVSKLGWDALNIETEARNGYIYLTGEAQHRKTCEMAEEVAMTVDGVTEVVDRVEIAKKEGESSSPVGDAVTEAENDVRDSLLALEAKSLLLAELGRHAFSIDVDAAGSSLSLRGEVPDKERERIALQTVEQMEGVEEVIDLLEIAKS